MASCTKDFFQCQATTFQLFSRHYKMSFKSSALVTTLYNIRSWIFSFILDFMAIIKLVLASFISLLAFAAGRKAQNQQFQGRQCELRRITTTQPSHRIQSEGGTTEVWDPMEDQFQCAGVAAMRDTIEPNSLSLPQYFPAPLMIYIVKGRGILGVNIPGCPETYHPEQQSPSGRRMGTGGREDRHQKLHRVVTGDVIAIPHGSAHWCYNDGNEDLVAVYVVDLNNNNNQLDQNLRGFMLAGGQSRQGRERGSRRSHSVEDTFQNVFSAMDEQLLAESFNVPTELARKLQQVNGKGTIVKCDPQMRILSPSEEEGEEYRHGMNMEEENGIEETMCTMHIKHNTDFRREADLHTTQAGRINLVAAEKLPILQLLEMSAERGHLMPNAMHSLHWSMTDQRVVYGLQGEVHIQVVDETGNTVMDEMVREGDLFVIPQFYACVARAGNNGFEYVAFKTSGEPMKSPMAGYTSVMRAMPFDVSPIPTATCLLRKLYK